MQVYNEELYPLGILVSTLREDMSNFIRESLWSGGVSGQKPQPPSVVLEAVNGYIAALGVIQVTRFRDIYICVCVCVYIYIYIHIYCVSLRVIPDRSRSLQVWFWKLSMGISQLLVSYR